MFTGYSSQLIDTGSGRLHVRVGGQGPALLLLHGHPQTHVMWHRVAGTLAQRHTVVLIDLPGYGDSWRPPADAEHVQHSKRRMAAEIATAMQSLGIRRYDVCAHDRGARVAHRLAMDAPAQVRRLMLLDIAPTLAMYEATTAEFARAYWHWFFLVQPAPLPERLIEQDPVFYLHAVMGRRHGGLAVFDPLALAEYERCLAVPGSATSICEDYRAAAGIDLVHDRLDLAEGRQLSQPVRVLWGRHGVVARCFDVLSLWRERAPQVSGQALDCGHYIAEEAPAALLEEMYEFFKE